jgi:hypothetical protein
MTKRSGAINANQRLNTLPENSNHVTIHKGAAKVWITLRVTVVESFPLFSIAALIWTNIRIKKKEIMNAMASHTISRPEKPNISNGLKTKFISSINQSRVKLSTDLVKPIKISKNRT